MIHDRNPFKLGKFLNVEDVMKYKINMNKINRYISPTTTTTTTVASTTTTTTTVASTTTTTTTVELIRRTSFEVDFDGWTAVNSIVHLGITQILGEVTPIDPTPNPPKNTTGDSNDPTMMSLFVKRVERSDATHGIYTLRLRSSGSAKKGFDVVHGPYVYSPIFTANQGDTVSIDWRAYAGADAYDVFGYLINVNTKATIVFINETATDATGSSPWVTASTTIPVDGDYQMVYISGTFDFTGGRATGAATFIDNFMIVPNQ